MCQHFEFQDRPLGYYRDVHNTDATWQCNLCWLKDERVQVLAAHYLHCQKGYVPSLDCGRVPLTSSGRADLVNTSKKFPTHQHRNALDVMNRSPPCWHWLTTTKIAMKKLSNGAAVTAPSSNTQPVAAYPRISRDVQRRHQEPHLQPVRHLLTLGPLHPGLGVTFPALALQFHSGTPPQLRWDQNQ